MPLLIMKDILDGVYDVKTVINEKALVEKYNVRFILSKLLFLLHKRDETKLDTFNKLAQKYFLMLYKFCYLCYI